MAAAISLFAAHAVSAQWQWQGNRVNRGFPQYPGFYTPAPRVRTFYGPGYSYQFDNSYEAAIEYGNYNRNLDQMDRQLERMQRDTWNYNNQFNRGHRRAW